MSPARFRECYDAIKSLGGQDRRMIARWTKGDPEHPIPEGIAELVERLAAVVVDWYEENPPKERGPAPEQSVWKAAMDEFWNGEK